MTDKHLSNALPTPSQKEDSHSVTTEEVVAVDEAEEATEVDDSPSAAKDKNETTRLPSSSRTCHGAQPRTVFGRCLVTT